MKNWKRAISLLLCAVMLLGNFPAVSIHAHAADTSGTCGENLTWTLDADGKLTISGTGAMYDYDAAPFWDYRDQIMTIVIEEGVTTLCHEAFSSSAVTSVSLPSTLESIGMYAFSYCKALTKIDLPEGLKTIGGSAFHGCDNLETLTIPSTVTELGSPLAESSEKLTVITFTGNMPTLGMNTFRTGSSSLTVYYPGTDATWDTDKMKNYGYAGTVQWVPVYATVAQGTCGENLTWALDANGKLTISGTGAMYDYNVAYNAEAPWYQNRNAISVVEIGEGVTDIGEFAFYACGNLTGISVPDSVTDIGAHAFYGCSSLTNIDIPANVTEIHDYTFRGCSNLEDVSLAGNVTRIGKWAFYNCGKLESIDLPETVVTIGEYAFSDCVCLMSINIPAGVTVLNNYTFSGCSALGNIILPENMTSIGEGAFNACSKLESIYIPDSLTAIGQSAFSQCTSLASVKIPKGVTHISGYAFFECLGLTDIDIPDGMTEIGYWAFSGCHNLKNITIPQSVETIGEGAFFNCVGFTDVYYAGAVSEWAALGENVPTATYIHYNCETSENHWAADHLDATCGKDGYDRETCTCGYERNRTDIPATGDHDFQETVDEKYLVSEATCQSAAIYHVSCSGCGAEGEETFEYGEIGGHIMDSNNTCTVCGYTGGTCGNNVTWVLENGTLTISGTGIMESYWSDLNVPWYSQRKTITGVVIEEGVTTVSVRAFVGCSSLTSVKIPGSVTKIGSSAFKGCAALADIQIPAGVTEIGSYAFQNCENLKNIQMPAGITVIGTNAFYGCDNLTEVYYGGTAEQWAALGEDVPVATYIHCNVTNPAGHWFEDHLDPTCTEAGYDREACACGYECNRTDIPATGGHVYDQEIVDEKYLISAATCTEAAKYHYTCECGEVGEATFEYGEPAGHSMDSNNTCTVCGAVGGTCGENLTWAVKDGVLTISGTGDMTDYYESSTAPWYSNRTKITSVVVENGVTSIGSYAFWYCSKLASIQLPASVSAIRDYAFCNCAKLTDIDLPAAVTSIGFRAFYNCSSLTAIEIPYGVKNIQNSVFYNCTNLKRVDLPDSVTSIYGFAFYGCSSLSDIEIPDSVTSIDSYAFYNCSSLTSIEIPEGVTTIDYMTFYNCSSLTNIKIPDSVVSIGVWAFSGCSSLTAIELPGVASIGKLAFSDCSSLTGIVLPAGITSIENQTFEGCSSLTDIVLPAGITSIGNYAFYRCSSLTDIVIPDGVTTLGERVFSGCSSLISIEIPDGVTSIGSYAFSDCSSLTDIVIPAGITSIGNYAFYGCSSLTDIEIPDGVTTLGERAFSGCGGLTSVEIPDSVTSIGNNAFEDCSSLTNIEIPDSVTSIGNNAFEDCSSLTSVEIPDSVTSIGTLAFYNCGKISDVYYGGTADAWKSLSNKPSAKFVHYGCTAANHWVADHLDATCAEPGYDRETCACGYERNRTDIPATGNHVYDKEVVDEKYLVSAATCTEKAVYWKSCGVCGLASDKDTFEYGEPNGHAHESVVTAPTCTEDGYTTYTCHCGDTYVADEVEKLGHDMGQWGVIEDPTCTVDGSKRRDCSRCDHFETEAIPAVGHAYESVVTAPTCTEGGYTTYTCHCGDTYVADEVDKLGHEMGEWGVVLDPTCTEEGTKQRNCSRCDHFETEPIHAVGHSYDANHNCTVCGQTGGYCGDPNVNDGKNVCWTFDEATGKLTIFGTGTMEEYSYRTEAPWLALKPEHVVVAEGVSAIGSSAFRDCVNMTDIDLPDSLTKIGTYAFQNCWALTTIALPDNLLVIESGVFGSSGITSIAIPSGVEVIDQGVFEYCESLQTVTFSGSVREIRQHAFFACSKLENLVLPEGLEVIGYEAFYACQKLTAVSIPNSVKEIHRFAFEGCAGLTSVEISENVTDIGEAPFLGCDNLTGIWVAEGNANYSSDSAGVLFDKNKTTLIQAPAAMTGTYTVPSSVTTIAECAFCSCAELKSITLPAGLKTIGALAFSGCSRLNDMIIPDGVISIGDYAFADCSNLESITVPESVTAIGGLVFHYCSKLKDVYYKGTESGWTALGAYVQNTAYIHYNCVSADKHWMTKTVDATCTEAGWTCETCSCGYEKNVTETEAALGHDMGQWETVKEATPYEDGQKRRNCSRCDHFETEVIPASGEKLVITTQPKSITAVVGKTVDFQVVATGEGLTYQWQWRKDTSSAWAITSVSGNKTASISIPVTASRNGYQYRCKITDAYGVVVYSGAATLTVRTGPSITTQPKDVTANEGTTATFKVAATGEGLTYQWQWRKNSTGTWAATTVSGNKTATIKVPATVARNGYQYRCKITDANNNVVYTNAVTLTVKPTLSVTTQPKSVTANVGETATFKVAATGEGLTYQWQWRANASSTWAATTVSGNKTATISVPATAARNGYQYRCVVTDVNGSKVYSDAATLTVKAGPAITSQPTGVTANVGATATFKVVATGEGLTYQWQWRANSSSAWASTTVSGNKTATISVPATVARNGYQYRCVVTDANGSKVYSNAATLTVKSGPSITTQPKDTYVKTGVNAKLTVAATGEGLTYQWQYRTSSSGTWKATTLSGAKTATLTIPGAVSRNGYQYRCVITDANGNKVTSNAATLTVFGIKTQPKSVTANVGETVTFKVAATGTGLTYQWQWRKNASSTWASTTVSGNKTATITVPATAARNGYQYRCKITDTNGNVIYSSAVTLTVN